MTDLHDPRRGIGRALIERTRGALDLSCMIVLLSAPAAQDYFPRVGFEAHPRAWVMPAAQDWRADD